MEASSAQAQAAPPPPELPATVTLSLPQIVPLATLVPVPTLDVSASALSMTAPSISNRPVELIMPTMPALSPLPTLAAAAGRCRKCRRRRRRQSSSTVAVAAVAHPVTRVEVRRDNGTDHDNQHSPYAGRDILTILAGSLIRGRSRGCSRRAVTQAGRADSFC